MAEGIDPLPELGSLDDAQLRELIDRYVEQEQKVSYRRRLLHGYIDILRSELISRRKQQFEGGELESVDLDRLTDILAGRTAPDTD